MKTVAVTIALSAFVACASDDSCDVEASGASKIGPSLEQQIQAAEDGADISVVITARDAGSLSCIRDSVLRNGGQVGEVVGSGRRFLPAVLPAERIEAVARLTVVQSIDPDSETTPPP
jgi:hypothetical protein